jgi:hypothetical protein
MFPSSWNYFLAEDAVHNWTRLSELENVLLVVGGVRLLGCHGERGGGGDRDCERGLFEITLTPGYRTARYEMFQNWWNSPLLSKE